MNEQSKIDLDYFENIIVYKSLTDEKYLSEIIGHIEPNHIANKNIKIIFNIIKDFYTSRGVIPTLTEIKTYLITDDVKKAFKDVVSSFSDIDKSLNKEELLANTERYLKEKAIYHTMLNVAEDITKGSIDTSYILEQFEKSCRVNLNNDIGLDFFNNIDTLIEDLKTDQPVIPTKWDWLDKKLNGGVLCNGRALYVFAGQTNIGKSIALGNIATNICRQGKNVLLISLEMPELMYARRLASDLTKIPVSNLRDETPTLKQSLLTLPNTGKIIIKEFPPNTITTQQLTGYIKMVSLQGIQIDVIVLDYLNLLKGSSNSNLYERIKSITEDVRAMTYKFNCPVISATQLNRAGYDTDTPTLDTLSESIGLGATADVIVGLTQSDEDKELNIINMHMMKNRFGQNFGNSQMRIDYRTLTITEDANLSETDGDLLGISSALEMLSN